ncbi:hypothetical protein [Brevibacillus gelatini]|jgi:hypothetical protein|uniref:hypothetical protein n=1 Tax=Brevibacillus gelatini TaxID=1655277 RepID=UPI001FEC99D1|nr:hypothetical protein [Brevibacillus gelatini]
MKAIIECLEDAYGFWNVGERYEVMLTWDSNSRLFHTIDKSNFSRFWNYPKDEKGYYRHNYNVGELLEGTDVKFKILQLG